METNSHYHFYLIVSLVACLSSLLSVAVNGFPASAHQAGPVAVTLLAGVVAAWAASSLYVAKHQRASTAHRA